MDLYPLLRPLLFRLDPETAHSLTLKSLPLAIRLGLPDLVQPADANTATEVMGLSFPNQVGLAAGLDKNGDHIEALGKLGFGFLEVGTITPRPQPGNPKPRLFRLKEARAIINRMGFNNKGVDYLVERVRKSRYRGILGINIGKNLDTPIDQATNDYIQCMRKVYPHAHYITVNVSSPNTKNLRDLQERDAMHNLLQILKNEQAVLESRHDKYVPLVVKIAPDLIQDQVLDLADLFTRHQVDGVIATNTTISREKVNGQPLANETGGLSGQPLFEQSTAIVEILASRLNKQIPIIAAGGIIRPEDAIRKIAAGADLVQLYSGLIYEGPGLISRTVRVLNQMKEEARLRSSR
ncbi:MAG: quinone-dependent dihydroorotate dehydrogenase [Methylococcales bacterium]|nr:quinone-dependent dihydroorotate dehydrogenase [Methylococcales bacterium]